MFTALIHTHVHVKYCVCVVGFLLYFPLIWLLHCKNLRRKLWNQVTDTLTHSSVFTEQLHFQNWDIFTPQWEILLKVKEKINRGKLQCNIIFLYIYVSFRLQAIDDVKKSSLCVRWMFMVWRKFPLMVTSVSDVPGGWALCVCVQILSE